MPLDPSRFGMPSSAIDPAFAGDGYPFFFLPGALNARIG